MLAATRHTLLRIGALGLAAVLAGACGDATGSGDARLTVVLTDAPHPLFQGVDVTIGEVSIIGADGGPVTVTGSAGSFNLLEFQNGVTATLASLNVDPGRYHQLRMVVTSASVMLHDTLQFADGSSQSKDLKVPSGAQTGIKFNLDDADGDGDNAGIEITPGETILVVDFDVAQNFKVQGSPGTPAGIRDVLFTPLLRAVVQDVAGSISGTISGSASAAVVDSVVQAELLASGVIAELQTTRATGLIQSDGSYSILFLSPGTYRVTVPATNVTAAPDSKDVVVGDGEDVTGVDFEVT